MSELSVGTLSGLAANSYVIDVASGSTLDLSAGAVFPAGSIIQVVSTTKTDTFSTTSTSFTDVTGLTATITPSSASSKILVVASVGLGTGTPSATLRARLNGGNADDFVGDASSNRARVATYLRTTGENDWRVTMIPAHFTYLDSPASTSATTYAVQISVDTGTGYVNRSTTDGDNAAYGRGASSITLMEIAG